MSTITLLRAPAGRTEFHTNEASSMEDGTAGASRCGNDGRQRIRADPASSCCLSAGQRRGYFSSAVDASREEPEEPGPKQSEPSKENEPPRVGVSDEHVLEVRLRGVCVVPNHNDDHHPEDVRDVGGEEAQSEKKPDLPRHLFVLGQDERHEGRGENRKRVDSRACGRDHDCYLNGEVLRHERETRGRRAYDGVHIIGYAEE